jgi:putative spermidine/putrescine transport system substrate-binding protein
MKTLFGSLCMAATLLAGVISPAAAQTGEEARFKGVTLKIGTWGSATRDSLRDFVAAEIVKRGGTVEFVIGSPQDNLAKLIAARGQVPFDLYEFLGTMRPEIEGRGLLATLDMKNIPNARAVASMQPNNLMVPTWITQEMIIYNPERFKEAGIPAPKSLADLRNPKLAGRIMIPDIASGGGIEAVGAFALTAGGDEANIGPGLKLIRELPGVRFWKAGGEVITQFKSGDIWVAMAHAGWAVRTAKAGVPVLTVPPQIGAKAGLIKDGYIGVVKGSRNQAAAEFFIDTYLSAQAQFQFAEKVGVVPVVAEARAKLAGDPVLRQLLVLDSAGIAGMARLDPAKIDLSRWNDEWNRAVAR